VPILKLTFVRHALPAKILGSNGIVGVSVAQQFLEAGARVVLVAQTEEQLKALVHRFEPHKRQLVGIVGGFTSRAQVEEVRSVLMAALNGNTIDHVVSAIGQVDLTPEGISAGDAVNALKACLEESLYPTIVCAQVFLPDLRDKDGSTYTIVCSGFAHKCYYPNAWVGTVKNAAMTGVIESLACDFANAKVRINGNCLHYGISFPGHDSMSSPHAAPDNSFAQTFLKIVKKKDVRGCIICHDSKLDTERFLQA